MERPLLPTAALLVVLPVVAASAPVYRCQQGDTTVFSDKPCAPNAQPVQLPPAVVIPAGPRADLLEAARQREQREQQGTQTLRQAEGEWQAQHAQAKADAERLQRARAQGVVVEGMSPADVRRIHGEPTVTSRNQKGKTDRETWSYLLDDARVTVIFVDGKVSSTRSRESKR